LPLIFYPVKPFACLGEPIEERSLIPVTALEYHGDTTGFNVAYFAGESLSHVIPW